MTYFSIDTTTHQAQKFLELIETLPYAHIIGEAEANAVKAIARQVSEESSVPEWQKTEVRNTLRNLAANPSQLVDEDLVFQLLK